MTNNQGDCLVDADHGHELLIRRYVSVIISMLNNIAAIMMSKRQNNLETLIYGSELVSPKIGISLNDWVFNST
jgi:hypothetical protein